MKKLLSLACSILILCLLLIPVSAADMRADGSAQVFEYKTGEFYYGTPTIDGEREAIWDNVPKYNMTVHRGTTDNPNYTADVLDRINKLTPYFQGMWDENYLYIYMYINTSPLSYEFESNYGFTRNSLNFFINPSNARAGNLVDGDFRAILHSTGERNRAASEEHEAYTEWKLKVGDGWYQIEAKVDIKAADAAFKLAAGTEMGFDTSTNVNFDGAETRTIAMKWCSTTVGVASNTSEYGTIKLVADLADPPVEVAAPVETTSQAETTTPATPTPTPTPTAPQTSDIGLFTSLFILAMAITGIVYNTVSRKIKTNS